MINAINKSKYQNVAEIDSALDLALTAVQPSDIGSIQDELDEKMQRVVFTLVKNGSAYRLNNSQGTQVTFTELYNAIRVETNYVVILYGNSKLRPQYVSSAEIHCDGEDRDSVGTFFMRMIMTANSLTYSQFSLAEKTTVDGIQTTVESLSESVETASAQIENLSHSVSDIWKVIRHEHPDDFLAIQEIVEEGRAQEFFQIGDQINVPWVGDDDTTYTVPHDIVSFEEVEYQDGSKHPGMWLQWHYLTPTGVQFNQNEALYVAENGLSAGTYYFTSANGWGNNVVANTNYIFTLTQNVPSGGQLVIGSASSEVGGCPDNTIDKWRIRVYASQTTTTAQEIVSITTGTPPTGATSLGSWSSSTKRNSTSLVNNMQTSSYGYNRYGHSAVRQYLNSLEAKGAWWTAENKWARPPIELATKRGFMAGYSEDFLSVLHPIKVTTAYNTAVDSVYGTSYDTYDTFFLPSIEQEYVVPQIAGVEGGAWQYWVERLGTQTPQQTGSSYPLPEHIRYRINSKTSAETCRLRSASRSGGVNAWYVNSSGYVNGSYATHSFRFAPACVIS